MNEDRPIAYSPVSKQNMIFFNRFTKNWRRYTRSFIIRSNSKNFTWVLMRYIKQKQ